MDGRDVSAWMEAKGGRANACVRIFFRNVNALTTLEVALERRQY
jgi:hypothetical protein